MPEITHDPETWPGGDRVWNVCRAIAMAEGANVEGAAPDRMNNPGDLSKGDEHGQSVVEYVILPDKEDVIHFQTKIGGWTALYKKVINIRDGKSKVYSPSMTWAEVAKSYAGNSTAWANNVAKALNVSVDEKFGAYFGLPVETINLEE